MQKKLIYLKSLYSLLSMITVILGILMITIQDENRRLILSISGFTFIIYGIIKIISYFSKDLLQLAYQYDLAVGIIAITIGFIILFWKKDYVSTVVRLISVFLIFDSLLKIQTSIEGKKIGLMSWKYVFIMSLLGVIGGICVFLQSFLVSVKALAFIGICLIIYGISNLCVVVNTAILYEEKKNGFIS